MAPSSTLPSWPPQASQELQSALLHLARDYALSHSIIYRPPQQRQSANDDDDGDATSFHTSVIHAPFALYPTPFPRELYLQAKHIQLSYNRLYANIASDFEFLEKVVGGNVSKVDAFQGHLWKIAKRLRGEGIRQKAALGLFRSDYLLHSPPGSSGKPASSSATTSDGEISGTAAPPRPLEIKQVEFNTISSSFGALSNKVTDMHRYLAATQAFPESSPNITLDDLPPNVALKQLSAGLAAAHELYGVESAQILLVVQDNERNAFDQRALEWELLESHGIKVIRQSFSELSSSASLTVDGKLSVSIPRTTSSSSPTSPSPSSRESACANQEISVVYYRAGYGPGDYQSEADWEVRYSLEKSSAIKCPSVTLQLAGAKKIQQVLAEPGVLSRFIEDEEERRGLEATFIGLYPLDYDTELGKEALESAKLHPERYVLKPQREGGGNNIYRTDIPPFLASLEEADRSKDPQEPRAVEGYILMDLILPPEGLQNKMVRANESLPRQSEVISELGIYGVCLFEESAGTGSAGAQGQAQGGATGTAKIFKNEFAGHLLRTKGRESDEGGVAVGFSVIDSPFLVD